MGGCDHCQQPSRLWTLLKATWNSARGRHDSISYFRSPIVAASKPLQPQGFLPLTSVFSVCFSTEEEFSFLRDFTGKTTKIRAWTFRLLTSSPKQGPLDCLNPLDLGLIQVDDRDLKKRYEFGGLDENCALNFFLQSATFYDYFVI